MHLHSKHCSNKLDQARQIRCLWLQLSMCMCVSVCHCVRACVCVLLRLALPAVMSVLYLKLEPDVQYSYALCSGETWLNSVRSAASFHSNSCTLPLSLSPVELTNRTSKKTCSNTIFVCYSFLIFSSLMKPLNICGASCCVYTQVCELAMRVFVYVYVLPWLPMSPNWTN